MAETAVEESPMVEVSGEDLVKFAQTGEVPKAAPEEPPKPAGEKPPESAPPAPKAKPVETAPASETDETAQDEGKDPQVKITNRDRKIARLTQQREHQRARAEAMERELYRLQSVAQAPEAPQATGIEEPDLPDLNNFESLEAYQAELKAYAGKHRQWAERMAEGRLQERQIRQSFEQAQNALIARVEAFRKTKPDFDAVTEAVRLPPALQSIALHSEHGPALTYYLGENFSEYQKLVALPPFLQAVEAGRLIEKLSPLPPAKPKPAVISAPPEPVEIVGANAGPSVAEEITPDGYLNPAWEKQHREKLASRR